MDKNKLPTLVGIVILVAAIATGVLLVENEKVFRLGAATSAQPQNVAIANITDSSFTVSWTTPKNAKGFVKWGNKAAQFTNIENEDTDTSQLNHVVNISHLAENTNYFFTISSDGIDFKSSGTSWMVRTGPKLHFPPMSVVISGKVISPTGQPEKNALVYIETDMSELISTKTSADGSWSVVLSNTRNKGLTNYLPINKTETLLKLFIYPESAQTTFAYIYPINANPIPVMTVGNRYDFRHLIQDQEVIVPKATVKFNELSEIQNTEAATQ